jgi:small subunit ribosomal protein S9
MIKQKETKQPAASQVPVSSGTGRRKSSVARVWLRRGKGNMTINGLPFNEYFDTQVSRLAATTPFRVTQEASRFDVEVNVSGGGKEAQAGAIKLGFARALVELYESLRPVLREHDLLSVDSRLKERKKYGQKGARRKFQFVKR